MTLYRFRYKYIDYEVEKFSIGIADIYADSEVEAFYTFKNLWPYVTEEELIVRTYV